MRMGREAAGREHRPCQSNGFSAGDARDATLASLRSYREHMTDFSEMRVLDVWYARIDVENLYDSISDKDARQGTESDGEGSRGGDRARLARRPYGPCALSSCSRAEYAIDACTSPASLA